MIKRFLKNTIQIINSQKFQFSQDFSNLFNEQNQKEFQEKGCTIVDNVATNQELDELISQTRKIMVRENVLEKRVCFSKGEMEISKSFIESGDKISFFFEPNVFDKDNKMLVPKDQLFNKIGHALHDLDPVFEKFTYRPLIQHVLKKIGYKKPQCVQSMYIFKNAKVGTPVAPHTDNTYLVTVPQSSVVGFWFALHDATIENGCMWGIPGSQRYPATHHMFRSEEGDKLFYVGEQKKYDISQAVPIEVKRGQMFIFHGDFVHFSKQNSSVIPRHAYTLHFIDADGHKWHEKNWLQRGPQLPFRDYDSVVAKLYS